MLGWVCVAISESLGRAWVMKAFCWTCAGAAGKGNEAAVFSSSSSETMQKTCRGIWAKGCSRAFAFQFLCFAHLDLVFYHFGENFSELAEAVCSHAVLFLWAPLPDSCGFITQLPSSTYFLPSSVPCKPLSSWSLGYMPGLGRQN